ncbi:Methyl-accepting chemotaxis protein [Vibrio vulnificus]|nr:chemotaxis protein [Vibrio vulnificus]ASC59886.1 Methyl-accepting chemotaxis protein [Vibrio vulnificus]AXX62666.1 Methyl-accepting chemotaxis protein [Vibrio vulnificus]
MSAMKQEAIVSINQENAKAIEERDAKLVKHIKEEQEQLVHIKCQKVDQTKS